MLTIPTRTRPVVCMSKKHMACNVLVQVGMVDGHGYDGQQEDTICDIRGPWHAHYVLYNRTYFTCLIFTVGHSSAKTTKIGPHGSHKSVIGLLTNYSNLLLLSPSRQQFKEKYPRHMHFHSDPDTSVVQVEVIDDVRVPIDSLRVSEPQSKFHSKG